MLLYRGKVRETIEDNMGVGDDCLLGGVSRVKERGGAVEGANGVFLFLFLFFVCLVQAHIGIWRTCWHLMGAGRDFQFGFRLRWQQSARLSSRRNGIGP